jgi:hypothetical protein
MTERPILFSGPMVRAILSGAKTQTRRPMSPQPSKFVDSVHPNHIAKHPAAYFDCYCGEKKTEQNPRGMGLHWCWWCSDDRQGSDWIRCPFGVPGNTLWVRETWRTLERVSDNVDGVLFAADDAFVPIANTEGASEQWAAARDNGKHGDHWRRSIHMPRWASRISLDVLSIRVERLQNISLDDVFAELGETKHEAAWRHSESCEPFDAFRELWGAINGQRASWKSNPWVWVVGFRRVAGEVTP